MKRILIAICLIFACFRGFAQTKGKATPPIITTKKVYLQYQNQKDSLLIPVVSDDYPGLQKALSDSVLFSGEKLQDVIDNYRKCGCGITSLNYKVEYANSRMVSIRLYYEGMGAYPSAYQTWLTLLADDGNSISLNTALGDGGTDYILQKYKQILISRINRDMTGQPRETNAVATRKELLTAVGKLKAKDITNKFLLTPKGLLVTTDNVLPHVIQNLEPQREVLFTMAELKKFSVAYSVEPGWHTTIKRPSPPLAH
ncbi:hypothetical protein [Mucilaginibacter psychrotolerans]|uniref:DUF4163 domain-containing protein n=1 Tax=Mucilaginibacter psychrotolerans TaxID=1524096 RepID=A0A4Y8SMU2_9SPHI|nr:hypothetical protein [Mucilaginibacter psychrotolerans]TFF40228.1 hypothetical protein E2R66_02970 [Mucilaginibacter psychrotolerans]